MISIGEMSLERWLALEKVLSKDTIENLEWRKYYDY